MVKHILSIGRLGGLGLTLVILTHHLLTEAKAFMVKKEDKDEDKDEHRGK